ncbi:hypothetical protein TNCV_2496191 [Trichonephila clavipes]|nr:hypothetical protein TNCV_2496191 [Trichonephila clavipes]
MVSSGRVGFQGTEISLDAKKLPCVIAALDSSVLNCIIDILKSPPAKDSYSALKNPIIDHFAESEPIRLKTLPSGIGAHTN